MDLGIGERLKLIRKDETQKVFGSRFGVNLNTIGRYESGSTSPSGDFIAAVCMEYGINPTWLIFGEGAMHKEQSLSPCNDVDYCPIKTKAHQGMFSDENGQIVIPQWNNPDPEMFDYIPLAETQLSAGGGAFVISEEIEGYYAFRKSWLNRVASSTKNLVLMRILGDSMAPTIQNDDTVMIDTGRKSLKEGMIYAIRVDSTVMIKRLSLRLGGKIQIISDNRQEYESYEAELKDLHIIGQIIFFCRTFATE